LVVKTTPGGDLEKNKRAMWYENKEFWGVWGSIGVWGGYFCSIGVLRYLGQYWSFGIFLAVLGFKLKASHWRRKMERREVKNEEEKDKGGREGGKKVVLC
jgi:hypothetical protein